MNGCPTLHVLALLLPCTLVAQTGLDLEARKASVSNLENHITERETRLAELAQDIVRLDVRVERRIDAIVKNLAESKDSQESKLQVATAKSEAIEGLRNAIGFYDRQRRQLKESLRQGDAEVPRDILANDVKAFDDRIEKRVEQILELARSFTQHEDYPKYIETEREDRFGFAQTEYRVNETWKLNHREAIRTEKQRKALVTALNKNIDDLKKRESYLEAKLEQPFATEAERDLYRMDYQRILRTLEVRNGQLAEFEGSAETPADATELSKDLAYSIQASLDDSRKDLRADLLEIFRLYGDLNRERARLAKMRTNLQARKAWLKEHVAK